MPATVSHALSMTTPNDPAYENQPQHWNSAHAVTLNVLATEISGLFSNKNGVSFGLDGTNITGSIAAGGAPGSISAGTTNFALGEVVFSNANGVSFGLDGATVTGTVQTNYLTTAMASNRGSDFVQATAAFAGTSASGTIASGGISVSIGPYITTGALSNHSHGASAANGSFGFQTLSFSNANNFSFGTSAGSAITGSYTVPTVTNSSWSVSDAATSGTVARLAFTNLNGVTLSLSSGAGGSHTIVGSHNALTSQSNQAVSNSAGSFTFQTLNFSNANNVTWGTSAGGIVTASVAAPGAAAENNWHHALGANTAGNTTASGSTIGLSGINLTISGTNDSVFNLSVPATSSVVGTNGISVHTNGSTISISQVAKTYSRFDPNPELVENAQQVGNASLHIQPAQAPNFQFDRAYFGILESNATNSTGSFTISAWIGFYTRNVSTLSLQHSSSTTLGITFSGTVRNSLNAGPRMMTMGWTTTILENDYHIGFVSRTTSGGANATISNYCISQVNSAISGIFGAASNATNQRKFGMGYYSVTTSGMPASIGFNEIQGTTSNAIRPPVVRFLSQTA